jgi:hypothetical protein
MTVSVPINSLPIRLLACVNRVKLENGSMLVKILMEDKLLLILQVD